MAQLLSKMQLTAAASADGSSVVVHVPITRSDVLHGAYRCCRCPGAVAAAWLWPGGRPAARARCSVPTAAAGLLALLLLQPVGSCHISACCAIYLCAYLPTPLPPACDVMEDVAIAYGYNNLVTTVPKTATVGRELPLNQVRSCWPAQV